MKHSTLIKSAISLREELYTHALKLTDSNRHFAEELIQKTISRVADEATAYDATISFATWIKMIMENIHLDTCHNAEIRHLHHLCFHGTANPFAPDYNSTYSTREIIYAMSRLTPDQAAVVTLRLQGYGHPLIARAMHLTPKQVKTHILQACYTLNHVWDS